MEKEITISTPFIKLDALLKFADIVGSGGEGKLLILDELVSVNGTVCTMRGKKCVPGDRVETQGVTIFVRGART